MAGLPGTGKSTLARTLAAKLNGVVLDKDLVRAAVFNEQWIEYSREQDDFAWTSCCRQVAIWPIKRHRQALSLSMVARFPALSNRAGGGVRGELRLHRQTHSLNLFRWDSAPQASARPRREKPRFRALSQGEGRV